MNYLEYFQRLSIPEQQSEFAKFIRLAQNKKLKTQDVVFLLSVAQNERYFDYIDVVSKILFVGGPFQNVIIFNKLLDFYLANSKDLSLNQKTVLQNGIIIRELNVANPLLLKQYKRILETKGLKAGKIADHMTRLGERLKGYRGLTESAMRRTRTQFTVYTRSSRPIKLR
jgi:hypothetical protein